MTAGEMLESLRGILRKGGRGPCYMNAATSRDGIADTLGLRI